MLIYNFQKEFLGIDEKDLRFLGFKSLSALRAEVSDFADLFVKTPGYIHNFKHVHWIDFITCADSHEESKVIINVNNKNYKCFIQISTAYLVDNPSSKAYLINLHKLKELSQKESESISGDIAERVTPTGTTEVKQILNTPDLSDDFTHQDTFEPEILNPSVTVDPYETPLEINLEDNIIDDEYAPTDSIEIDMDDTALDVTMDVEHDENYMEPLNVAYSDDLLLEDTVEPLEQTVPIEPIEHSFKIEEVDDADYDSAYVYDPSVASDELGLPLDLIEEFIQDFIEQAKEFKPKLFESLEEHDLDNLKILSHKLKGVAANLRIEDALEKLTIINTSNDTTEIHSNLNTFYKIITKLSGEEIKSAPAPIEESTPQEISEEIEEEIEEITLDFKEDDFDDIYSDSANVAEEKEEFTENFEEEATPLSLDIDDFSDDTDDSNQEVISAQIEHLDYTPTHYSKEEVANEIGLDLISFNELFNDYILEANEITTRLKSLIQNEEIQTLKNEAHKLKGMSNNMRIEDFNDSLSVLMNSTNTEELLKALSQVEMVLIELSKTGE